MTSRRRGASRGPTRRCRCPGATTRCGRSRAGLCSTRSSSRRSTSAGPVTEVPDTFTASDLVGGLWIGDDGQPSTGPARADGWPAPVEWSYAFPGGVAIVWFALGDTPQEVLDATVAVESLGYDGRPISRRALPGRPLGSARSWTLDPRRRCGLRGPGERRVLRRPVGCAGPGDRGDGAHLPRRLTGSSPTASPSPGAGLSASRGGGRRGPSAARPGRARSPR